MVGAAVSSAGEVMIQRTAREASAPAPAVTASMRSIEPGLHPAAGAALGFSEAVVTALGLSLAAFGATESFGTEGAAFFGNSIFLVAGTGGSGVMRRVLGRALEVLS